MHGLPNKPDHATGNISYHWNNGLGVAPGAISLKGGGVTYGPYNAVGQAGQNGVRNATWVATANNVALPAGTYTVVDSDPRTWSYNDQSRGAGFVRVWGSSRASSQPAAAVGVPSGGAQQEVAISSEQLREAAISTEQLIALKAKCSKLGMAGFELNVRPTYGGLAYFDGSLGLRSGGGLRPVRHPPQSGWLDEWGRLKGGHPRG